MTQVQERILRKYIETETLEKTAERAKVSVLTVAKVLAHLPVNDSGRMMVTRFAETLASAVKS